MFLKLVAFLLSILATVVILPQFIKYQIARDEGQQIREEGPKWHEVKAGTPSMGGIVFILVAVLVSLICVLIAGDFNQTYWVLILGFLGYGIVGFLDDGIKYLKKRNMGLRAYQKLLAQIVIAIAILIILQNDGFDFSLQLPLVGTISGFWLFAIFAVFWLVGFSNAVNLSDGLDGLASGLSIVAYLTYAIIARIDQNYVVEVFCLAVAGSLFGFLVFNHKPAKIFMGDVGSLALGGGLAIISIVLHRPFSLLLIGIVFVFETLSVILQVLSFKLTGKRIFKMTPVHHHFEMSGLNEWQIDLLFWSVGIIASVSYLILF